MKLFFTTILILGSSSSYAYKYKCYSIDDNQPYNVETINMYTNGDDVTLFLGGFGKAEKFKAEDSPSRETQSNKQMKLSLVESSTDYPDTVISKFLGDKALLSGGYKLRNGKIGGFIKTTGHGYSWANYLCIKKL